jgi:hypothetical protein
MPKIARTKRAPTNQLRAAAKLDDLVKIRAKTASWVGGLLSGPAGLTLEPVPEAEALRLWGYGSEESFVRIAYKFNSAMKPKRSIRPPELILHAFDKNVADLIDFITGRLLYQPSVLDQPLPVLDAPVATAESNLLAKGIPADLAFAGVTLRDNILNFTLSILTPAYLPVEKNTDLSRFPDKNTLIGLALAFIGRAASGYFSRPIPRDELEFPWGKYDGFSKQKDPEATVSTIVDFFLNILEQALRK